MYVLCVCKGHHRESFVDLMEVHIIQGHASVLQCSRDSVRRCHSELDRVTSSIAEAAHLEEGLEVVLASTSDDELVGH